MLFRSNPKKLAVANTVSSYSTTTKHSQVGITSATIANVSINDYIVSANNSISAKVVVTDVFSSNNTIFYTGANIINLGESLVFQTKAAIEFESPQVVAPGTTVVSKTDTSVKLNYPLLNPILAGYDYTVKFSLGNEIGRAHV